MKKKQQGSRASADEVTGARKERLDGFVREYYRRTRDFNRRIGFAPEDPTRAERTRQVRHVAELYARDVLDELALKARALDLTKDVIRKAVEGAC